MANESKEENIVKVKLKKIGVLQMAKFQAISCAIMGLFLGIVLALYSSLIIGSPSSSSDLFGNTGFLWILISPITCAIFGFLTGIIGTAILNLLIRMSSGLDFKLQEIEEETKSTQSTSSDVSSNIPSPSN